MDQEESRNQFGERLDPDRLPIIVKPKFRAIFIHKYWIVLLIVLVSLALPLLNYFEIIPLDVNIILIIIGMCFMLLFLVLIHTKLYQMVTIYEVNRGSVVKKYGIVHKRTLNVPMDMVTDLSIERDIPDHIMHTSTLLVNTAGTNEYAIHLKYISLEYARWLHEKIVELKKAARTG
ncbi:MAG: PH domain-containing protein [Candidatus Micrarchaeota archaeon]